MNSFTAFLTFTKDPLWPWSTSGIGVTAAAIAALLLVGLTVWTYSGVAGASPGRVLSMIALRLTALALALMMLFRPSLASKEDARIPSTLIIVGDDSESMTIQDEVGPQSRWDYLRRLLAEAEPILQKLRDEHNVAIVRYRFSEDIAEYDSSGKAEGKRTDTGQALQSLFNIHGRDNNLRALLLLSDGADNGTRYQPLVEAARWRTIPCPIHTFGLGKPTTGDRQRDIAFADIVPVPSPVAIKGKLTVKGYLDAPGFEQTDVTVRLLVDDKEVAAKKNVRLDKAQKNEVTIITDAPATRPKDGEIKVTLKVDPVEGEMTVANNEISTFVTVTQEGISVLLVDQPRFPEPQIICDALSPDPRIRLYPVWLRADELKGDEARLFQFDKQHYDAIILGDVSARRLSGGNKEILDKIGELVREKGTGLMMMGGTDSFGNSDWAATELAKLLPVDMSAREQIDRPIKVEPTPAGLGRYVMRLADKAEDNRLLWNKLPELDGITRLGNAKPTAIVLAVRAGTKEPILVGQDIGKGRTLAFAGDTTWKWQLLGQPKTAEGVEAHARFWKQVVLWLAHQDESEGNVWVKPERRRLDAGEKLNFTLGLRGKGGVDAPEAHFEVKVMDPKGNDSTVPTAQEGNGERGTFWKTDLKGEYRLVVRGWGKDTEGQAIPESTTTARFLVSQNDVEMVRRAADHEALAKLANSGGGKFHKAEDFVRFLKDMQRLPAPQARPKTELWPDWRRSTLTPFRVLFMVAFMSVLCLEWFCRRYWGLV
jgi:uncharacterized membrane protein